MFGEMIVKVKQELSKAKYVCVSCDCWSSYHKGYFGINGHYFDQNLKRRYLALACKRVEGQHSYDVLTQETEEILKTFGIQNKTTGAITDSASNFIKSFKLFKDTSAIDYAYNDDEMTEVVTLDVLDAECPE